MKSCILLNDKLDYTQHTDLTKAILNKRYAVVGFSDTNLATKLISMGIHQGCEVSILHKNYFGNIFYINFNNLNVALRKNEAKTVIVA
jgi:Fe2+ transport system protein FeoA